MIYKLKKDIPAFMLHRGDKFEFREHGYVHEYMDDVWIGVPKAIVEETPEWFELCSQEISIPEVLDDFKDALFQFMEHLGYIKRNYDRATRPRGGKSSNTK